ncbi:MAG: UDP-N-acetylmuramoyl-L-alanine--D-glutamate ligase [Candidatus Microsaccharimonas sp.]
MKIAIAGYGVEGESNYRYWAKDSSNDITIVDEQLVPKHPLPEVAKTLLGPGVFEQLDGFDLVVRTAGLAPYKIKTDGKIWSATNEFFEKCPADIIGVTGSKGKGTTSSLITSILEAAGKKVWLVGNIGIAAIDILDQIKPEDIVVYELSSFQLWDIESSPKTAVVLMIEQEHLDVHKDMDEYVNAKGNIARFQKSGDLLIYNGQNEFSIFIAHLNNQQTKVAFPSNRTTHVEGKDFYNGEQKICSVDSLQIKGEHNISNATAAIDAVWQYTQDATIIEQGIRSFKGLPHRLAYVKTVRGVDYYDDSIATTPGSAIAALRAFAQPKVIILGGSFKGSDFTELAIELTKHDVQVILIGDEAPHIAKALDEVGFSSYETIENATATAFTKRAYELAEPGSVVLLSPSAASFGLFKNYVDRGEQFVSAVNQLPE